jgi:hypothetical protein
MKFVMILAALWTSIAFSARVYDAQEKHFLQKASDLYDRLAPILAPTNVPFADIYKPPIMLHDSGVSKRSDDQGDTCYVYGQFIFRFDQKSDDILMFRNIALEYYGMTNAVKETCPSLSIDEAAVRAKHYLSVIGIKLPEELKLMSVLYDKGFWNVFWASDINGYAYDDFFDRPPAASVLFHEKFGFVVFSRKKTWPLPKSLKVVVSREEAIIKASKAVPLVMKTPHYLQARLPGFKAKEVKSAELLISVPNWLLDPERAIWLPQSPPKETRLCWVIRFTTVDAIPVRPRNFKPIPPDILIYIDADTGDIVGANFT